MTSQLMNYASRVSVENFIGKTFPEISNDEFDSYLLGAEAYIHNFLGYNAETTTSGILQENVVREKSMGKINAHGNLVIDLKKPPINFDVNNNPLVSMLEYNLGGIRIPLQLTDGSLGQLNTLLEASENRKKIYYPSLYFFPVIATITPTAKTNLFRLQDTQFWVDISYTGGYAVCPADIAMAANYLTAHYIMYRKNPNFNISIRQGQYAIEALPRASANYTKGQPTNKFMETANELLNPYRRFTW